MSIRIVTDSVSDLPREIARAYGIAVVPLYVTVGGETYRDGVEMDADRFYSLLPGLPSLPTTSQPSVADFESVYRRLLDEGRRIVSIHVSAKLSGTLNSATRAMESLDAASRIEIVDSRLAGGAQALLALSAARWTGETSDLAEVTRRVRRAIPSNHGYVLVDTLEYLRKGGRIGKAQAFLGGILNFKPIISIRDGEAHPVERPRSYARASARIIEIVRALAPVSRMHVSYATGLRRAEAICAAMSDLVEPKNVVLSRFGPVLGTHLGPNTIGVAVTQGSPDER